MSLARIAADGRHQATKHVAGFFEYSHLPPELQAPSRPCDALAADMIRKLHDGPELTTGLRKLLEAKDCFVRAAIGES